MNSADVLRAELVRAARSLGVSDGAGPVIERPRDEGHGDLATNLAMQLAKPLKKKPRDVADALLAAMDLPRAGATRAEIAGPGFINFWLDESLVANKLNDVIAANESFGRSDAGKNGKVNVEFVSANPTGPLHVGHGRQAALGDAIATLLEWTGWDVTREFYYNDAGAQIDNLAASVEARLTELKGETAQIPEGGYHGE